MNRKDRDRQESVGTVLQRKARWGLVAALASLLVSTGGCGHSSGDGTDGSATGGAPTSPPPPPIESVLVTVTVKDPFGAPVPGAEVRLLRSEGTGVSGSSYLADQDGRAEILTDSLTYGALVSARDMEGVSYESTRRADDHLEIAVTLHPSAARTGGVGKVSVISISEDGRELVFSARLYVIEPNASRTLEDWNLGSVGVLPCEPDVGSDAMIFEADCVEGAPGFDAAYTGSATGGGVYADSGTGPLALSVLLDQGGSVLVTDPEDRRLLAAKYLQTRLEADDQVALAVFASDSASTGEVSLLPNQPVTIYPVEAPGFTSDRRANFPTIDALASLEGGASPLHAAVGELLTFTASSAPADSRRAVVVLASGGAYGCGGPEECRSAQEALLGESASAAIPIITVGLSDPSGQVDRKGLGTFAQSEHGAVFWARDAKQVPTIFGRLPAILGGRDIAMDAGIRLESTVPGAFAPGSLVVGTLRVVICPWDCNQSLDIPFAVRIPRAMIRAS